MSLKDRKAIPIVGLRGRDGSTPSEVAIPEFRAKEIWNCDLYQASFARKRGGSAAVFALTTSEAFTGVLSHLSRHVPTADETLAELWGADNAATPVVQRLAGGTAWASPTLKDNIATRPQDVVAVSFNGKNFMFFDSSVDRSHVWDGSTVRRTGLATPAAATVANTGSGSYAATLRYYKIAYRNSTDTRRSELSAAVSFTPSGSGTHARLTKPAAINEGETHWIVYASADDQTYVAVANIEVATTTYDDNTAPADYSGTAPQIAGSQTVPTSAKYGMTDGNRLLQAGAWETSGAKHSRVWFTPVLGTADLGDDERIPDTVDQENWIDLDENDGGFITGMGGPLQGVPWVFKYRQVWKLVPTGEVTAPYLPRSVSKSIGCIRHQSIVMAEDEMGNPAIYFLSHRGPYRAGPRGLEYLGRDIENLWATVNLGATNVSCHAVYHADKHQVWFWLATNSANDPNRIAVFDVQQGEPDQNGAIRNGWSIYDGDLAAARCSTMFANTLGATMSRDLKPYTGKSSGTVILKGDTSDTDDAGTAFQAYVDLPTRHFAGLTKKFGIDQGIVLGSAGSHTLRLTLTRDYGVDSSTANVTMTAAGSETRTQKVWESGVTADARAVQIRVGDASAVATAWTIDALVVQVREQEPVAA